MLPVAQNLLFIGGFRVTHAQAQHEPVQLRLGKWVRSVMLNRILGRQNHERARQRVSNALDRYMPLSHRLEQGRLRLRRGAVYLISQDDVREDWTRLPFEQ